MVALLYFRATLWSEVTQCQSVSTFESEVQNSLSALEPRSMDYLGHQHHTKKLKPKIALHFKVLRKSKAMLPIFIYIYLFFFKKKPKILFFETWFANLDGVWGWMHSSLYVKNWTCWYAAHTYTVQTVCQVVDSTAHHSHCTSKSQRPLCRWLQTLLQKIQSSQPI